MLCPTCGAINHNNNWKCGNCSYVFREFARTAETPRALFQTPLKQPQQSKLITLNSASPAKRPGKIDLSIYQDIPQDKIEWIEDSASDSFPKKSADETSPPVQTGLPKKTVKNLVYVFGATVFLLVINIVAYQNFSGSQSAAMFARAEKAFAAEDYPAARTLFTQFLSEYPDDELTAVARARMNEIGMTDSEMKQPKDQRLELLIQNAEKAYNETRFLLPENNNVIVYTSEVLKIDPANTRALELQTRVVLYYQNKAFEAKQKRRYQAAIDNFEKILKIIPHDEKVRKEIATLTAIINK